MKGRIIVKKYKVKIRETLEMTVEVEAESREEAAEIVSDKWYNSEYILDAECFTGVEFIAREQVKNRDERER